MWVGPFRELANQFQVFRVRREEEESDEEPVTAVRRFPKFVLFKKIPGGVGWGWGLVKMLFLVRIRNFQGGDLTSSGGAGKACARR